MKITYNTTLQEIQKATHSCSCDACSVGCRYGSGSLVDEDVKPMAKYLGISVDELKKEFLEEVEKFKTKRLRPKIRRKKGKPYGTCIFFDEKKGCKVHEAKPLECSIAMGCKPYGPDLIHWFHAHYYVNAQDPASLKEWSWAIKDGTIPGATIEELQKKTE